MTSEADFRGLPSGTTVVVTRLVQVSSTDQPVGTILTLGSRPRLGGLEVPVTWASRRPAFAGKSRGYVYANDVALLEAPAAADIQPTEEFPCISARQWRLLQGEIVPDRGDVPGYERFVDDLAARTGVEYADVHALLMELHQAGLGALSWAVTCNVGRAHTARAPEPYVQGLYPSAVDCETCKERRRSDDLTRRLVYCPPRRGRSVTTWA